MKITFDIKKDAANIAKHGVSLALCTELEWDSAMTWPDMRHEYGEERMTGLALIDSRLYLISKMLQLTEAKHLNVAQWQWRPREDASVAY